MRQRLLIWFWKMRYAWRVFRCTKGHEDFTGAYLMWCVGECAQIGWQAVLENEGSVAAALKTNPIEEADAEVECWTD